MEDIILEHFQDYRVARNFILIFNTVLPFLPEDEKINFFDQTVYEDGDDMSIYLNERGEGVSIALVDGGKIISNLRDGELNGLLTKYYSNGQKYDEVLFQNGLKQGIFISYDINGKIVIVAHYVDDRRNGSYVRYYSNGNKKFERNYVDGIKESEIRYRLNGEKISS